MEQPTHKATYTWTLKRVIHKEEPFTRKGHTHRKNLHMKDIYRRDLLRILGGAYTQRKIPMERTYKRK